MVSGQCVNQSQHLFFQSHQNLDFFFGENGLQQGLHKNPVLLPVRLIQAGYHEFFGFQYETLAEAGSRTMR
jgi:hypothetical protein